MTPPVAALPPLDVTPPVGNGVEVDGIPPLPLLPPWTGSHEPSRALPELPQFKPAASTITASPADRMQFRARKSGISVRLLLKAVILSS
jgi:hypothetical protein